MAFFKCSFEDHIKQYHPVSAILNNAQIVYIKYKLNARYLCYSYPILHNNKQHYNNENAKN